jgi:hypothetical protein
VPGTDPNPAIVGLFNELPESNLRRLGFRRHNQVLPWGAS